MVKEPHFTPQRMLNMLGLKSNSLGPYALIPGPKERSESMLKLLDEPQKSFTFLDYEMHTQFEVERFLERGVRHERLFGV